jgi:hypothetical protein
MGQCGSSLLLYFSARMTFWVIRAGGVTFQTRPNHLFTLICGRKISFGVICIPIYPADGITAQFSRNQFFL